MRLRLLLLGAVPLVLVSPVSAAPSSVTVQDGRHEVADPRGDIGSTAAGYHASSVTVAIQTLEGDDPRTSENWTAPEGDSGSPTRSTITWFLDTDGDGNPGDYRVLYMSIHGKLTAEIHKRQEGTGLQRPPVCSGEPLWDVDVYAVRFDADCIGAPAEFGWVARFNYSNRAGGYQTQDTAPDRGLAGPVGRGPAQPSATTTPAPPAAPATTSRAPATAAAATTTSLAVVTSTTAPPDTTTSSSASTTTTADDETEEATVQITEEEDGGSAAVPFILGLSAATLIGAGVLGFRAWRSR